MGNMARDLIEINMVGGVLVYLRSDLAGDRKNQLEFKDIDLFDCVYLHFQQNFSYIAVVSLIGGGNRRTRRKPPTCRKSPTNFIT
jgi:hypothetical protein